MNIFRVRSCLRIWSRETGSAVPSRVSLLISILRLNLVLTYYGIPPEFRGGVHLFTYNRHTPSGQSRVYRVTQLRTDGVASKPQGSNECCLGRSPWTNSVNIRLPAYIWHGEINKWTPPLPGSQGGIRLVSTRFSLSSWGVGHIIWSMATCQGSTRLKLQALPLCRRTLGSDAIGTQLRDPINSLLTPMAYGRLNK